MLVALAHFIEWRECLTIVRPDTLIRWHRHAFRLFWRRRCRPCGRPRIPHDLQQLITQMAKANRTWGTSLQSRAAPRKPRSRYSRSEIAERSRRVYRPRDSCWLSRPGQARSRRSSPRVRA
jgi:hypothetical protein